jgi:hypothetical protein
VKFLQRLFGIIEMNHKKLRRLYETSNNKIRNFQLSKAYTFQIYCIVIERERERESNIESIEDRKDDTTNKKSRKDV